MLRLSLDLNVTIISIILNLPLLTDILIYNICQADITLEGIALSHTKINLHKMALPVPSVGNRGSCVHKKIQMVVIFSL